MVNALAREVSILLLRVAAIDVGQGERVAQQHVVVDGNTEAVEKGKLRVLHLAAAGTGGQREGQEQQHQEMKGLHRDCFLMVQM